MRRKIYDQLLQWKSQNGERALMLNGARRVGKSYIAEEFAKREYRSYLKIDFNDISEENKAIILSHLSDRDRLFSYLQLAYGVKLYERQSLILFDEIQMCPKVRGAIKYLVADGRYDYIETGSLLSIQENVKDILIPSEEDYITLFPMDFEEFMWACGQEELMEYVKQCFARKQPLESSLHRKCMTLLKEYMVVGGMPQVVARYVATHDFAKADDAKRAILNLYRADIAKHAGTNTLKVQHIFDAIPSQLTRHEKQFRLSALGKNARMRAYAEPFQWLEDSMIVNTCYNSTEPSLGLRLNEDRSRVKCYMADTGLLYALAFSDMRNRNEAYQKIILGKLELNEGMFVENIVAQMLRSAGHNLYFFSQSDAADKESRMEIDFLLVKDLITSRHNIVPLEVKSGTRFSTVSLQKCINKYGSYLAQPCVIYPGEYKEKDGIQYLPLYMAPFL